jgi:hypothetical protein
MVAQQGISSALTSADTAGKHAPAKTSAMRMATSICALALMLAACGSPGPGPTPPTNDPQQRGLQFAKCMREHGIDMPDPNPDGNQGIPLGAGTDPRGEKFKSAQEACREYSPFSTNAPGASDPKFAEARLKFAACMREHGVDWPDPRPSGSGPQMIGPELTDDPDFQPAMAACQKILTEAGGGGGFF